MKRICCFLLSLCVFCFGFKISKQASAMSKTNTYAKVLADCVLFKSSTLNYDLENVYFIIPETYFVTVLDKVSDSCCKVQYDKFVGFVESDKLIFATFVPVIKNLTDVTCDIEKSSGTQVWSSPTSFSNVLTVISAGTKNIKYIAKVFGDIPSGGESNLWFYIAYTPPFNSTNVYEGYVYSENVSYVSSIPKNLETNPEIIESSNYVDEVIYISSSMKTILTILIAVPIILLILIILYKLTKRFSKNTDKTIFQKNVSQQNLQNNFAEISDENNSYSNSSNVLKSKINKLKDISFVKKLKTKQEQIPYPDFSSFESDDDML